MTTRHLFTAVLAILGTITSAFAADPVVSNLTAAQRPGTNLVDITYDVTADIPTVKVTLEISSDGGTTYSVPVTSATGAVGDGVTVGSAKTITWNAGVDWDGKFTPQTRFRLIADDRQISGFAKVEAGNLPASASSWAGALSVDSFYMAKTEVTWSEFQTVRTWAAANVYDIGSAGAGTGPNRPVTNVNWYQTLKWCNARSEQEGLNPVYKVDTAVYRTGDAVPTVDAAANGYRLPSEKEWEFAARGGVKTNGYEYSGSNDINAVAWYSNNSGNSTQDVATKLANELGLSDMSGNVWEWCFDASDSNRVYRGGSWIISAGNCRLAIRYDFSPANSLNGVIGFRVVRSSASTGAVGNAVTTNSIDTRDWTMGVTTHVNGTVIGAGSYLSGTSAALTATPSAGYLFGSWTGDASGSTNPLTILMDADKTVGANFVEDTRDPDADGLTNYQEIITYGTNPDIADSDGDSISDGAEIEQGRNPLISEPVVSNLSVSQRPGTKLVDISYDVTADTPTVKVTLEISTDGGVNWAVPVTSGTGAIGNGVTAGSSKTITWNAGVDWDGKLSPQTRFRVVADDLQLPALAGLSGVSAGALPASSWAGAQSVAAFYMGKTEVTWAEFQTVRTWAAANGYDIGSVGAGTGPNRPVTDVSWYQTLKWCNARSEKEGLRPVYKVGSAVYRTGDSVPTVDATANGYRLPSEKEWEFAARGGVKTNGYEYSGSNDVNAVAWYSSNIGNSTQDVATKLANELGLSDMSGNAWEWCFDIYSGSYRVFRGGSWGGNASYCRVAYRTNNYPTNSGDSYGFRVARSSASTGAVGNAVTTSSVIDTRDWTLAITTPVNGTLSGAGSYLSGTSATVTATPSPGYLFSSWSGDVSGSTNPLTFLMDSDKTVDANFVEDTRDPDADGLSNYQEIIVHLTNPGLPDTDGDGIDDRTEVEQGGNPLVFEPVVSNLSASQRAGTKLVEITYDVTADTPTVKVTLEISNDGGVTWAVPVTSATGAIGNGVTIGSSKTITWNAGVDWDGKLSLQTLFRVVADDVTLPTIEGFSGVSAGTLPTSSWAGAQAVDAFYIGRTEVTWSEWQTVRTWAAANGYDIGSVGAGGGPNRPVTNVSWYHVLKWCNARSEKEGLTPVYKVGAAVYRTGDSVPTVYAAANGYRLPSEKEWEFAARGGVNTNGYEYSGSNDINAVAWYSSNSGGSTKDVATKQANELGISDMSGNVFELCFDIHSGSERVIRGGRRSSFSADCRVAFRNLSIHPSNSGDSIGFRVAISSFSIGAAGNAITNSSILDTRNWTLGATNQVNGTISGAASYLSDTSATLTATPLPGYLFGSWSGSASGSTNPLTLLMDSDKTVGANFVEDTRDPDADGLTNYQEIIVRLTDPNLADTDGDAVNDGEEVTDATNPLVQDSDSDSLNDGEEKARGTNPLSGDSDGDGLGDLQEEALTTTNPLSQDSDGNGIADAYEDPDNDGILNGREVNERNTNPKSADSDGDGLSDTYELLFKGTTDAFKPRIGDRIRLDLGELGFQGSYKLVGKPPVGMTFNATTGVLEGKLIGKPATSALTIQILEGTTVVRSIQLSLPVGAFPTTLTGSWQALLEDATGLPQGLVTATLSSPGKWSATLDVAGSTMIRKAAGTFDLDPAATSASMAMTFPAATGLTAQTLTLSVSGPDALASGTHSQGNLRGFRLARGSELPAATKAFTMVIDQGEQDGFLIPAGIGWATGVISTKGSITLSGQLGDAQAIKGSMKLGATGQALLWLKPYRNLSSRIGGVVSLHETGGIPATALAKTDRKLWWYREADTSEPSYGSGFGPVPAEVGVRSHAVVTSSAALATSLDLSQSRFRNVIFDGGGLPEPAWTNALPEAFVLDASFNLAAVPIPGRLMTPWQGSVNPKMGSFSGTLDVAASNSGIILGKAAVSGVLFPSAEVDAVVGAGLVKIPVAGRTGAFRTGAMVLSK
jgi:formylglycine-generating enzyme required for sulfatase activity